MQKPGTEYSLQRAEHYLSELTSSVPEVVDILGDLCARYFKFVEEKLDTRRNTNRMKFIVLRGIDTLFNVFNYVLFYTKNPHATHYHCQKAFYLYIEFIDQISDDEKSFLQLTTKDATSYVYKKSVFEIDGALKSSNEQTSTSTRAKLDAVQEYMNLYKTLIFHCVTNNIGSLSSLESLFRLLQLPRLKVEHIVSLTALLDKLQCYVPDVSSFHAMVVLLANQKTEDLCDKTHKFLSDEWMDKARESPEVCVQWLCS